MADVSGLIMTVLGISFQLTSTLFAYAKHVKDARGEIKQISNEAFALIGILQHIKMQDEIDISGQYAKKDSRQDMDRGVIRQVLQECLEFLQELHQKLMPSKGRLEARVQKLKWPFQASEVNEHLQRLERVKTYFMLALMTDEIDATRQLAAQISDLRTFVIENSQDRRNEEFRNKYRKAMEWLSPVDPQQSYLKIVKSRTPGSGVWFTDSKRFIDWRDSKATSVFWLNGITGAGKTTLMTTAVENLLSMQYDNPKVTYFYCSFANGESLDMENILGSILAQLCEPEDSLYGKLETLYDERWRNTSTKPIRLDSAILSDLIVEKLQTVGVTYILIDAINECSEPYGIANALMNILERLSPCTILRLFLSSISEKGIESSLQRTSNLTIETLHHRQIWNDIHLYVETNLEAHPRLRQYSPDVKSKIRQALTGKANGMFRYVYCQVDLLSRLRTPNAVIEALDSLPPTLDQTYERLLARIDAEEDRMLTREILQILAFSFRPLKLKEICELLQVTPGLPYLDENKRLTDPRDVVDICGSFLQYQRETDIVALAHHSVKTYLISNLASPVKYFQLSEVDAHRNLAIKCLTYLSLNAFASGPCRPGGKVVERNARYPLFRYAGEHWALHAQAVEEHGHHNFGEPLWTLLKSFLVSDDSTRRNFSAWVQLLIPTSKSIDRTRPLYYAASFGLTPVVRHLIDTGADIEARGGRCEATPLNIASFRGNADVVQLLLEHGADPEVRDADGRSAMEWAKDRKHRDVLTILQNWKKDGGHHVGC